MVGSLNFSKLSDGIKICLGPVGMGASKFSGCLTGIAELKLYDQSFILAFHGSLYNLKELFEGRNQVSNPFEGIIGLYLKEGMRFLNRLRGDFVIAIWDGKDETLYLAADRFCVHPLFYYHDKEHLVFASHIKSILASSTRLKRTINPKAIIYIIGSSIIPTPETIFKEIKKLPPRHFLKYKHGEIKLAPYWEIDFLHPSKESESVLRLEFRNIMNEVISKFLEFDNDSYRIGTFLSGGVDSSTITGVLTQLSKNRVRSFSIGFDEPGFSEINYARIASRAFGAEHHEYFVTPGDTYDTIPVLLEAIDEPFANASAIPAYFCAKMAKENGVDVLYAGDGGDELFAGNQRYADQHLFEYYHNLPAWIREPILKPLIFSIAKKLKWAPFMKGKKYIQRASIPYDERITSYDFFKMFPLHKFIEDDLLVMVGKNFDPYKIFSDYYHKAPAQDNLNRHLYLDWILTLADNDLIKVTRMTEAAGLTVRFPFLDYKLVEFSTRVPANIKMRGTRLRSFQKKTYADLLPQEILKKKKHGFGLPIPIWLRTDKRLNELMHDLVLSPQSIERGYFKKKALNSLIEQHRKDETSFYGTVLWNLMILELWMRKTSERIT
jgi:asparagine synthase (glutamine-hydrolysing)